MTTAAMLTLVGIAFAFVIMMLGKTTPDIALLGMLVIFTTIGIVEPELAFSGFSNTGMLTIAGLLLSHLESEKQGFSIKFLVVYLVDQNLNVVLYYVSLPPLSSPPRSSTTRQS